MEAEALRYWRFSRSLAGLRLAFGDACSAQPQFAELVDELEVMAMHTEWPLLRQRVLDRLAGPAVLGRTVAV